MGATTQKEKPLHYPEPGTAATNTQTNIGDSFDMVVGEVGELSKHSDKSDRQYNSDADYAAMFSEMVMHNTERRSDSDLCQ